MVDLPLLARAYGSDKFIVLKQINSVPHIERFSNECRKTKTKVIAQALHNKHKLPNEPIITRRKYM